jgi:hypothetical protein
MNSAILLPVLVSTDRIVATLTGAVGSPCRVRVITDPRNWTGAPAAGDALDLLVESGFPGDFPMTLEVFGDPQSWPFIRDTRAFYCVVDRLAEALGLPLVLLDGPGYETGKRFHGDGGWEWIAFDGRALGESVDDYRLSQSTPNGVIDDAAVAQIAERFEMPLGPHDLDHEVGASDQSDIA